MRAPIRLSAIVLLACSSKPRQPKNVDVTSPLPQSATALQTPSGNYLGTTTIGDAEYAEYLRLSDSGSAFYDGLRWIRICEVTKTDLVTAFRTAPMFGRVFAFHGKSHQDGIRGELTGFEESRSLVFRLLDQGNNLDRSLGTKAGFYSDLRYVAEAGDNVGAELLVGAVGGQRVVALMIAEGSAGSPRLGFNIVDARDTLRFELWRDRTAPHVTAVFRDSLVSISLSNQVGPPRRLRRLFSLRGFYDQPSIGECVS